MRFPSFSSFIQDGRSAAEGLFYAKLEDMVKAKREYIKDEGIIEHDILLMTSLFTFIFTQSLANIILIGNPARIKKFP